MSNSDRHTVGPRPYSTYESTQEHMRVYGLDARWRTDIYGLHAFMVPGKFYKINTPRGCYRVARGNELAYFIDLLQAHDYKLLHAGTPFMYLGYDTAEQVTEIIMGRAQRVNMNGDAFRHQQSTQSIKERAEFIKILLLGGDNIFYVRPIVGDIITEVNMK